MKRILIRLLGWYLGLAFLTSFGFLVWSLLGIGVLSVCVILLIEGALCYFVPHILTVLRIADPCPEEVLSLLQPFAASLGIDNLKLYTLSAEYVNVIPVGFGRNRAVLITSYALQHFPIDEIRAILAHEIGHFRHHDLSLYAGIVMAITILSPLPGIFASSLLTRLAFAVLVPPFVLMLPLLAVSRFRERSADLFGLRAIADPLAFIRALKRSEALINRQLATREIARSIAATIFSPHPSFSCRIRHARATLEATNPDDATS